MNLSLQYLSSFVSHSSSELYLLHTSIVHVIWCPRQTQHLRFQTSFRPEDHTDWERAPPSYDLQSSARIWMNIWEFLPPWTTLSNCPSVNNLIPYWNPYRKCRKNWTWFDEKRVGQVWELQNLKPVPLQKAARIGNFALVNPNVSPMQCQTGGQGRSCFRPDTTPAPVSDSCRGTVTYTI